MLYLETAPNTFTPWTGQPINGIVHPRNIEQLWTAQALADIGLYKPVEPPVPEGKIVTDQNVQRVGGVVTWVYTLENVPPPSTNPGDYKLSRRQLRLGLVRNGFPLDFVPQVIATIADPLDRDEATIWYEDTKSDIEWTHPMTQLLMSAAASFDPTFTLEKAAQMWITAAGYAA